MTDIDDVNGELKVSGSNLYAFYDPYNNHNVTIYCTGGGTDYLLAKTMCETAEQAEAYIERNAETLRAAAKYWGVHLTKAEEQAAEKEEGR